MSIPWFLKVEACGGFGRAVGRAALVEYDCSSAGKSSVIIHRVIQAYQK